MERTGPWVSWTWRYDSGLVAGSVGSLDDALALTGAQQAAIGFFCGSALPTIGTPLTGAQCTPANYGATRLVIPAPGTENDDHNPPRIAPRHVFDIGVGTDNLFQREHFRTTLRFAVTNFTNKDALYNFLSTFSGTHFMQPRALSNRDRIRILAPANDSRANRPRPRGSELSCWNRQAEGSAAAASRRSWDVWSTAPRRLARTSHPR